MSRPGEPADAPLGSSARVRGSGIAAEKVFLVLGLVGGLAFIAATPIFRGADEPAHWRRAYQISEGGILAERRTPGDASEEGDLVGGLLPASLRRATVATREGASPSAAAAAAWIPLEPGERSFVDFRNTAVYPPIPYLPHALAIGIARSFEAPPLFLLYLGRIAGLAGALALVFLAIRLTPIGKHLFLLLALAPMSIRQMGTINADTVTNGASLLLLALVLRGALAPSTGPPGRSVLALSLCAAVVALSKVAYFPMSFLCLLCRPAEPSSAHAAGLSSRRRLWLALLAVVGPGVALIVAWLWLARDLYIAQSIAPDADPGRQLAFVVSHPLEFAAVLLSDLKRTGAKRFAECLGYAGGLPHWLAGLHAMAVAAVALFDGRPDADLGARGRVLLVSVFAATYVAINAMNYLGWSPIGAPTVPFLQGRYYIPILPLPFLLLTNPRLSSVVPADRLARASACFAVLAVLLAVIEVVRRWHGT